MDKIKESLKNRPAKTENDKGITENRSIQQMSRKGTQLLTQLYLPAGTTQTVYTLN